MTDPNDRMTVGAFVHLRGRDTTTVDSLMLDTILNVAVGGNLNLMFERPEALSGFLLAIAESPEAQQFLARAGAGFSLTVEPLPQPAEEAASA